MGVFDPVPGTLTIGGKRSSGTTRHGDKSIAPTRCYIAERIQSAQLVGGNLKVVIDGHAVLAKLWKEGWAFNSKRPFGNGNWQHVLRRPLIEAGFVSGQIYVEFEEFVEKLIYAAFFGVKPIDG